MDISTLFSFCAFGALIGIVIAFVKPSFFAYDGGKVPGLWPMVWIWGGVLIASLLAAGYHSDKAAQERIDAMRSSDADLVTPPATESPEESAPAQSSEPWVPPPPAAPTAKPDEPSSN